VRVLIAEDNALLREGLVLLLTSAGYELAGLEEACLRRGGICPCQAIFT
jgi:DNA-binding response OmpR family regulator